jgi:uncharacterized protein
MTIGQRPWRDDGRALHLALKVIPNAKADTAGGVVQDADGRPCLVLRLTAPPVEGKANAAVIAFLAKALGCPRAALTITSGETSRQKRVTWSDPPADAEARLRQLADEGKGRGGSASP